MFWIFHLMLTAVCVAECLGCLPNVRAKFTKFVMFAGLGLIYGVVPLLTPRDMFWGSSSSSVITAAALAALIGVVVFAFGWRLVDRPLRSTAGLAPGLEAWLSDPSTQRALRRLFWITAIIGTTGWVLGLIFRAGSIQGAFAAGRLQLRGSGNLYLGTIVLHLQAVLLVPGFLGFFLPRRHRLIGIAFALTMAVLWFFGQQGTRAIPLGLIGAVLMGYVLWHKITIHRFLIATAAGIALVMLAIATFQIRHVMAQREISALGEMIISRETYRDALLQDPLSYHQFLVAAVEHFPRDHPYLHGATYLRLLVFYLPRQYFSWIKPPDPNNVFARAITGSPSTEVTIPPTMMGDGYINFWGFPGVIVVMFFNGLLFGYAARKMREHPLWLLVIGPAFVKFSLMAIRGQPYVLGTTALSAFLFVWLLGRLCGLSFRRTRLWVTQFNGTSPAVPPERANTERQVT